MFRRHDIRRDDQVAFVFAILVIHDENHLALAKVVKDFFYAINWHNAPEI
jgi:hypothetical protein